MTNRSVARAHLIATEACRAAANGADFLQRVRDEVGIELEVVDRETEAKLAGYDDAHDTLHASVAMPQIWLVWNLGGDNEADSAVNKILVAPAALTKFITAKRISVGIKSGSQIRK